ncbi:C69 family dipeptidase [Curvibacter sp. APW13]|uniref:C69 family dipeptidase n=1 Tax=Curvibacter sp. APW13 TaxID=3077236 RepID=UPI0028DF145E|nr:C69 family dipeptidase [Curvibacter sp. APW13]MDT8989311.1 C69 family dipeptidase [Curvibacter sp. APW13]
MCDTLYVRHEGVGWFAKNSDRESDEPQALVWRGAVAGDAAARVRCTYIDVPQLPQRHGVLLSQPSWIWGGEIGVNAQGVAIGNEAVFSKLVDKKGQSLLGMDLLRLGLERAATAREALDIITELLQAHGQGGPAGYRDKGFRYDNSFLIADAHEAWVLETAGRLWAAKRVQAWAISNCYSLGEDFDLSSPGLQDAARKLGLWDGKAPFHFGKAFDTRLYAWVGGAHRRRALNAEALACGLVPSWQALTARLRDHGQHGDDFARHDNRQVCLHAASFWRPSQTTASLIARLEVGRPVQVAATGTSAPCLSLFEPLPVGAERPSSSLVLAPDTPVSASAWAAWEPVHQRALFDADFRQRLRAERDALEAQWWSALERGEAVDGSWAQQAADWRARWQAQARVGDWQGRGLLGRWWRQAAAREAAASAQRFV